MFYIFSKVRSNNLCSECGPIRRLFGRFVRCLSLEVLSKPNAIAQPRPACVHTVIQTQTHTHTPVLKHVNLNTRSASKTSFNCKSSKPLPICLYLFMQNISLIGNKRIDIYFKMLIFAIIIIRCLNFAHWINEIRSVSVQIALAPRCANCPMPESERGRARLSLSSSRLHDDDDWRSWVGVTNEAQKVAHTQTTSHTHTHTRAATGATFNNSTHTHSFSFTLSLSLCALALSACWQYWKRARESKWQALRYRRDTWGHFGTSVSDKTSSGFHASSSTLRHSRNS